MASRAAPFSSFGPYSSRRSCAAAWVRPRWPSDLSSRTTVAAGWQWGCCEVLSATRSGVDAATTRDGFSRTFMMILRIRSVDVRNDGGRLRRAARAGRLAMPTSNANGFRDYTGPRATPYPVRHRSVQLPEGPGLAKRCPVPAFATFDCANVQRAPVCGCRQQRRSSLSRHASARLSVVLCVSSRSSYPVAGTNRFQIV